MWVWKSFLKWVVGYGGFIRNLNLSDFIFYMIKSDVVIDYEIVCEFNKFIVVLILVIMFIR